MSFAAALGNHVERCIARDFDLTSAEPDDDGDYGLASGGSLVWVRPLLDADPALVRVWSIAAVGVKRNVAVLREINDQNLGMNVTRCFLAHDSVMDDDADGDHHRRSIDSSRHWMLQTWHAQSGESGPTTHPPMTT